MDYKGYHFPDGLFFHKDHSWVRLEPDGTARIGMTEFYSRMAGDTTYADLPEAGDEVEQDQTMGKLQSSKWVGKLIAPISGEIIAINETLEDDFMLINRDPYASGWIARVQPVDWEAESAKLMSTPSGLQAFIDQEIARIDAGGAS